MSTAYHGKNGARERVRSTPARGTAHTPGPWNATQDCYDDEQRVFRAVSDTFGRTIVQTSSIPQGDHRLGSPYTRAGMEANARLIAAAPELVEAATQALLALRGEGLNDGEGAIELLTAAIARAGGQA